MAPATAASYRRSTPAAAATSASSAPATARSALLAVTTGLPLRRAVSISSWAGWRPPMTSTTTSTSSRATRAAASVPMRSAGMAIGRSRSGLATAMPTSSRRMPVRAATSSARVRRISASAAPTLPQPSRPTRTVGAGWAPAARRCAGLVRGHRQTVQGARTVTCASRGAAHPVVVGGADSVGSPSVVLAPMPLVRGGSLEHRRAGPHWPPGRCRAVSPTDAPGRSTASLALVAGPDAAHRDRWSVSSSPARPPPAARPPRSPASRRPTATTPSSTAPTRSPASPPCRTSPR